MFCKNLVYGKKKKKKKEKEIYPEYKFLKLIHLHQFTGLFYKNYTSFYPNKLHFLNHNNWGNPWKQECNLWREKKRCYGN